MPKIDESRPFLAVNVAILTVSDTRTEADDRSGDTLAELAQIFPELFEDIPQGKTARPCLRAWEGALVA